MVLPRRCLAPASQSDYYSIVTSLVYNNDEWSLISDWASTPFIYVTCIVAAQLTQKAYLVAVDK